MFRSCSTETFERSHCRIGASLLMERSRFSTRFRSSSETRSILFRRRRSAKATCSTASFSTPSPLSSSRCCSTCLASTSVTIPSRRASALVHEEGLGDGRRVGHACGLDHNPVQLQARLAALGQLVDDLHKVLPHRAADAAIHHLDEFLLALHLR